jgi:hypothetical protein
MQMYISRPAPKKARKKTQRMQGEQNTVHSSKATKKTLFFFWPFWAQGVI